MSFISDLKQRLICDRNIDDLSSECFADLFGYAPNSGRVPFICLKETKLAVDLFAVTKADALTESQIATLCDTFFQIIRIVSYDDFGLNPGPRNPNGLLCFVFEEGCSAAIIEFIKQQTRIEHWNRSAVSVAWAVDLKHKKIYTHNNPVSYLPPVFIARSLTFPSFSYLKSFVETYQLISEPLSNRPHTTDFVQTESYAEKAYSTDNAIELFNSLQARVEEIYELLKTMSKQQRESYFVDNRITTIVNGSHNLINNTHSGTTTVNRTTSETGGDELAQKQH
ncbi:MAG: hypothetical protein AAFU53_00555 [Cyanobacteria bacterium J06632_3]